ncbi:MAG: Fic family protein [Burkholderiales bacterium]|nr:Fic family protein [Burkholderiales bacterium]
MADPTGELFLNAEMNAAEQRAALRRVASGEWHRVAAGIFSTLPEEHWADQLRRERVRLLAALFPKAVISYRTAFESVINGDEMFLAYGYHRVVELPGVRIHLVKGPGPQPGDAQSHTGIYIASTPRMFLDNLSIDRSGRHRNAPINKLEEKLIDILHIKGAAALNDLRDQAKAIAPALGRTREAALFDKMIGNLLGTRPDHRASSVRAQHVALGIDHARMALFDRLADTLRKATLPHMSDSLKSPDAKTHFAFLESYFSNFIEGTKFSVNEAINIALRQQIAASRPKDSHDIAAVFLQAQHPAWRALPFPHTDAAIDHLSERHRIMMEKRPEIRPGEFKIDANAAGGTRFVEPRLVRGTLKEAVRRLSTLAPGLPRALLAMFIVTEIHPFDDGNGRLARLVMNSELSHAGECRIIVPSIYRDVYLGGLRALSRDGNPEAYVDAMCRAQQWSASFVYEELDAVIDLMQRCQAFEEPSPDTSLLWPQGLAAL